MSEALKVLVKFACPLCSQIHRYGLDKPDEEVVVILNCPIKNEKFEARINQSSCAGELIPGSVISPENEILFETGHKIFGDSRSTLRDFSNYMATISSGAIVTYTALIGFVLPKGVNTSSLQMPILVIPPILFLLSFCLFVSIYQPVVRTAHLYAPDEIRKQHQKIMLERAKFIAKGMYIFLSSTVLAIWIVIEVAVRK